MVIWYIYIIIGVSLLTYCSISQAVRDIEDFKSKITNWLWWVVTIGCALLWPILVASAVYDGIKEMKSGEIEL